MSASSTGITSTSWINTMFVQSIADSFTQFGIENGLDELAWQVQFRDGDVYIFGSPDPDHSNPVDLCVQWANAMGMTEYLFDASEGQSTWYLYDGPWLIEIYADQN